MPTEVHVLRVFTAPDGQRGNPLDTWSWEDEAKGRVRSRYFEATGAAAVVMGSRLGRLRAYR